MSAGASQSPKPPTFAGAEKNSHQIKASSSALASMIQETSRQSSDMVAYYYILISYVNHFIRGAFRR